MNKFFYHNPVLLEKSICELITDPNGIYVDVTFGGGGHSNEVLCRLSKKGKLFAFDQDVDSKKNLINDRRFFVQIFALFSILCSYDSPHRYIKCLSTAIFTIFFTKSFKIYTSNNKSFFNGNIYCPKYRFFIFY